jgi:hypothetical protein
VLRGRGAEPEQPAHGSSPLGGRSAQRRKDQRDTVDVPSTVDDDGLWGVDQAAPAVLDTPEPVRPAESGPALGRATG